jgi:hypothetical protein
MLMWVTRAFRLSIGLAAVVLLVAGGCGSGGGTSGTSGTVTGKVTLSGQSAPAGSMVTFMASGGVAAGPVGADGTYTLKSGGKPQVPAGKYQAMVSDPQSEAMSQEEVDKIMKSGGKIHAKATPSVIPKKYSSIGTSGLSYEVKAGTNKIDIELTK